MDTELLTRSSVESTQGGGLTISLVNVANGWAEEQRLPRLQNAIASVIDEVQTLIPFWAVTRLIEVASDFQSEVVRWQRELGEPEGVTIGEYGEAHGKVLVWGDGGLESTYAVVILSEPIALSFIEGEIRNQAYSRAVLGHELAHVHDEFVYRRVFHQPPPHDQGSWTGLCHTLAYITWSEFFANFTAYRFHKQLGIDGDVLRPAALIRHITLETSKRISFYRLDADMPKLWFPSLGDMSQLFAQSARSLGLLVVAQIGGHDRLSELFASCDQISLDWGQVVRQLVEEFQINLKEPWSAKMLCGIEKVIEDAFHLVGLYPTDTKNGIWVGVS